MSAIDLIANGLTMVNLLAIGVAWGDLRRRVIAMELVLKGSVGRDEFNSEIKRLDGLISPLRVKSVI